MRISEQRTRDFSLHVTANVEAQMISKDTDPRSLYGGGTGVVVKVDMVLGEEAQTAEFGILASSHYFAMQSIRNTGSLSTGSRSFGKVPLLARSGYSKEAVQ